MWSDVPEAEPAAAWVELAENGWGALMGWAAGAENLRRHPSSYAGRTVTGHTEHAGVRRHFVEPFTAADQEGVDDDIDAYLREAGLPPRPRGYRWFIRVPGGHAPPDSFLTEVDAAVLQAAGDTVHPRQLRPIFEAVIRDFYA
jgi:hypothetical protein